MILLLDHDEDGALGVVLNRPSQLPLQHRASDVGLGGHRAVDALQRRTGRAGVRVGRRAVLGRGPARVSSGLTGDVGLVDLDADPMLLLADLVGVRVFSGYAGWGAGQLEAELVEGSWYLAEALPNDLLDPDPERLLAVGAPAPGGRARLRRDLPRRPHDELASMVEPTTRRACHRQARLPGS